MTFHPYLTFAGNCREAFNKYKEVFGGELFSMTVGEMPPDQPGMPGADPNMILHASLTLPNTLLMGSDDPSGQFDGKVDGMSVSYTAADVDDAKRVFTALAEGGETQVELAPTFFAPAFGMCTDRFGTPWMVLVDQPDQG